MRFPGNTVTLEDTRPSAGGRPGHCLYCGEKQSGPHLDSCVCIDRPIKVRVTIDLVITTVRSWTKEEIEFKLNDSSWCSNNILTDVDRHAEAHGCLCDVTQIEYVGEATPEEAEAAGLHADTEND